MTTEIAKLILDIQTQVPTASNATAFFEKLQEQTENLSKAFGATSKEFGAFLDSLEKTRVGIQGLVSNTNSAINLFNAIKKYSAEAVPQLEQFQQSYSNLIKSVQGDVKITGLDKLFKDISKLDGLKLAPNPKVKATFDSLKTAFEDNIKSFSTGGISFDQLFENLIPKTVASNSPTRKKIQDYLDGLKTDIQNGITNLNDTTAIGRVNILDTLLQKMFGAGGANVATFAAPTTNAIKTTVDEIINIFKLLYELNLPVPENLFANYKKAISRGGNESKKILNEIFKELSKQDTKIQGSNQLKPYLESLGFSSKNIDTEISKLQTAFAEKLGKLGGALNIATTNPNAVKDLESKIQAFKTLITEGIDTNKFASFGPAVADAFKIAGASSKAFSKEFEGGIANFEKFRTEYENLLKVLKDVPESTLKTSLLQALEAYKILESQFRLDKLVTNQTNAAEKAISEVDKKLAELRNGGNNQKPFALQFQNNLGEDQALLALREKAKAQEEFGKITQSVENKIAKLNEQIVRLNEIKNIQVIPDTKKDLISKQIIETQNTIASLETQKVAIKSNEEAWNKHWAKLTDGAAAFEGHYKQLQAALNQSNTSNGISGQLSFVKGFLDLATSSDVAANALKTSLSVLEKVGGASEEGKQRLRTFTEAFNNLFTVVDGKPGQTIPLIQVDQITDATKYTQVFANTMYELGKSTDSSITKVQQLGIVAKYLNDLGQGNSKFGLKVNEILKVAEASQLLQIRISGLKDKLESYGFAVARADEALLSLKGALVKAKDESLTGEALVVNNKLIEDSYRRYERAVNDANAKLHTINSTQAEIASTKSLFSTNETRTQLELLDISLTQNANKLKDYAKQVNSLKSGNDSFKGIAEGVDNARRETRDAFEALDRTLRGNISKVFEGLIATVQSSNIDVTLRDSLLTKLKSAVEILKTGDITSVIGAGGAISNILKDITDTFKNSLAVGNVSKDVAAQYLEPWKALSKGLENVAVTIAGTVPKINQSLNATQQTELGARANTIRDDLHRITTDWNKFESELTTRNITEQLLNLQKEISLLQANFNNIKPEPGNVDTLVPLGLKLKELSADAKNLQKDLSSSLDNTAKTALDNLFVTLNQLEGKFKELNKVSGASIEARIQSITSNYTRAVDSLSSFFNNNYSDITKILTESLKKNSEASPIDIAPFKKIGKELVDALSIKGITTEQRTELEQLKAAYDPLLNVIQRYNALVKIGNTGSLGTRSILDNREVLKISDAITDLTSKYSANKDELNNLFISGNLTQKSAEDLIRKFATLALSTKDLGVDAGHLTSILNSLEKTIGDMSKAGIGNETIQVLNNFRDGIKQTIEEYRNLENNFKGGAVNSLSNNLNKLVTSYDLVAKAEQHLASFSSQNFMAMSARGAGLEYEELRRVISALGASSRSLGASLSATNVGLDPAIRASLTAQKAAIDQNIESLTKLNGVFDSLRSTTKIETFEKLKTALSGIFDAANSKDLAANLNGAVKEYSDFIQKAIISTDNLKNASSSLSKTMIDNFKAIAEKAGTDTKAFESFLNILKQLQNTGTKSFTLDNGVTVNVGLALKLFNLLSDSLKKVNPEINTASDALKDRLGTATGQAEIRLNALVLKFGDLQKRLNSLDANSNINQMYGSIRNLMSLLDKPLKDGPFFTLPKESFAPIKSELTALLATAKEVAGSLNFNLQTGGFDKNSIQAKEWQKQLNAANLEIENITKALLKLKEYEANSSNFATLRGNLHGASTTLQELAHEGAFLYSWVNKLFQSISSNRLPKITVDTNAVQSEVTNLQNKFNLTTEAAQKLNTVLKESANQHFKTGGLADAEQYSAALKQLEEAFVKFRSGMTQAAMGFQMLGDAMLEPFKKAKENFEQFSDTMGNVRAVTNVTVSQFEALTRTALLMGATSRFTAEQAAEALRELAKAGFTAEQQIATLPSVMRLAQAAATELATAASIATIVMSEFRMDPETFNTAADVITLAANRTLASVEDLGYSFKYVGALAANVGADFGELTGTIALLHNSGMRGTMAGTALRGMLQALYNPTRDEAKLIQELGSRIGGLGLQIQTSNGTFVGFASVLEQLEQAGITSGEVLRLFGQRAGPGMAALIAQGSEKLRELEGELKNAEGTTAHMAQIMEETLKGKLLLMRSSFQALADQVGKNLSPALMFAADVVSNFVSSFVALREEFPSLSRAIDVALSGIALFASVLGGLAVTFSFILVPVKQFFGFLRTLVVTTLAGSAAITAFGTSTAYSAVATKAASKAIEEHIIATMADAGAMDTQTVAARASQIAMDLNTVAIGRNAAAAATASQVIGAVAAKQGAIAAGQLSLWAGFKNIVSNMVGVFTSFSRFFKFALSWQGLVLGAVVGLVSWTLAHGKGVEQTNIELQKQSEILAYNRKESIKLNNELVATAERMQRNKQLRDELNKNNYQPENQQSIAKLNVSIEADQQKMKQQLKAIFDNFNQEGSELNKAIVLDVAFDEKGNFTKFVAIAKDGKETFNLFSKELGINIEQLNQFNKFIDDTSAIKNRQLALDRLAGSMGKVAELKKYEFFKDTKLQFSIERNPDQAIFSSDLFKNKKELIEINKQIDYLQKQLKKVDTNFIDVKMERFMNPFADQKDAKNSINEELLTLRKRRAALTVELDKDLDVFSKAFITEIPAIFGKSQDAFLTSTNKDFIVKAIKEMFANYSPEDIEKITARILADLEQMRKKISDAQILGGSLKAPTLMLSTLASDIGKYMEEANKTLKTKLDEQKKILDEAKVVVDEVKKYQQIVVEALSEQLKGRNQQIEFAAKVKLDTNKAEFDEQVALLEKENRIIKLPFAVQMDSTNLQDSLKQIQSISSIILDYDKRTTSDQVELQIANSRAQVAIKYEELEKKKAAYQLFMNEAKNLYGEDTKEYAEKQKEQQAVLQKALEDKYQVQQQHYNLLLEKRKENFKKLADVEKAQREFDAKINTSQKNQGTALSTATEQAALAKQEFAALSTVIAQSLALNDAGQFDNIIALLDKRQGLIDQIISAQQLQPNIERLSGNLAENLQFKIDTENFDKEFAKAQLKISDLTKDITIPDIKLFDQSKVLPSSFTAMINDEAFNIRGSALRFITEGKRSLQELAEVSKRSGQEVAYGSSDNVESLKKSATAIIQTTVKTRSQVEAYGQMFKQFFGYEIGDLGVNQIYKTKEAVEATKTQLEQSKKIVSGEAQPIWLNNTTKAANEGLVILAKMNGEAIATVQVLTDTNIKPFNGLSTILKTTAQDLTGFKSFVNTQIDDLTRQNKVVELPISFKTDFNNLQGYDFTSLGKYSAEVLSYEVSLNERLLAIKQSRLLTDEALEIKTLENNRKNIQLYINQIEDEYNQLAEKNGSLSRQDQEQFKNLITAKKTDLKSFLQQELTATSATYQGLYQLREELENKKRTLIEQNISFQANAAKNLMILDDLGRSDSEKAYLSRQRSLQMQADADAALSAGDYDRAKALLEKRQTLIDQAISSAKPEDTISAFFLRQDQTETVAAYNKVQAALQKQNATATSQIEARLDNTVERINTLKSKIDEANKSLNTFINNLYKVSTNDIDVNLNINQRMLDQQKTDGASAFDLRTGDLNKSNKAVNAEIQDVSGKLKDISKEYEKQYFDVIKIVDKISELKKVDIAVSDESYIQLRAYANQVEKMLSAVNNEKIKIQMDIPLVALEEARNQFIDLTKQQKALAELNKDVTIIKKNLQSFETISGLDNQLNQAKIAGAELVKVLQGKHDVGLVGDEAGLKSANDLIAKMKSTVEGFTVALNSASIPEELKTEVLKLKEEFLDLTIKPDFSKEGIQNTQAAFNQLVLGFQAATESSSKVANASAAKAANESMAGIMRSIVTLQKGLANIELSGETKKSLKEIFSDAVKALDQLKEKTNNLKIIDPKQKQILEDTNRQASKLYTILTSSIPEEEKLQAIKQVQLEYSKEEVLRREQALQTAKLLADVKTNQDQNKYLNDTKTVLSNLKNIKPAVIFAKDENSRVNNLIKNIESAEGTLERALETGNIEDVKNAATTVKTLAAELLTIPGLTDDVVKSLKTLITNADIQLKVKVDSNPAIDALNQINYMHKSLEEQATLRFDSQQLVNADINLKNILSDVQKLQNFNNFELKGSADVDVAKARDSVQQFSQQASTLLTQRLTAQISDIEFVKQLGELKTKYDSFRTTLQPAEITFETPAGFEEAYTNLIAAIRSKIDTTSSVSDLYALNDALNMLVIGKQNLMNGKDIFTKVKGKESIDAAVVSVEALKVAMPKQDLTVKIKANGQDVTSNALNSVESEVSRVKVTAQSLSEALKQAKTELSNLKKPDNGTDPAAQFADLERQLDGITQRIKEAQANGSLSVADNEAFAKSYQNIIKQMSEIPGVSGPVLEMFKGIANVKVTDLITQLGLDKLNQAKDSAAVLKTTLSQLTPEELKVKTDEVEAGKLKVDSMIGKLIELQNKSDTELKVLFPTAPAEEVRAKLKTWIDDGKKLIEEPFEATLGIKDADLFIESIRSYTDKGGKLLDAITNKQVTLSINADIKGGAEVAQIKDDVMALDKQEWQAKIVAYVDVALSEVDRFLKSLNQVQSREITITTNFQSSGSNNTPEAEVTAAVTPNKGGLIPAISYFAKGGLSKFKKLLSPIIPGVGDKDTVPAMLTPGEFVISKKGVASVGTEFLELLNKGLVQFRAAGGMIYNSPINTLNALSGYTKPQLSIPNTIVAANGQSSNSSVDINLTIGNKPFKIKTPREEVGNLVSALQYLERSVKR